MTICFFDKTRVIRSSFYLRKKRGKKFKARAKDSHSLDLTYSLSVKKIFLFCRMNLSS